MKWMIVLMLGLFMFDSAARAQLNISAWVDTTDADSKKALDFYRDYLNNFSRTSLPDFKQFWSKEDCEKYKIPDQLIYGLSSDFPTYLMGGSKSVMYIKPTNDFVHIKAHFGSADSAGNITTLSITNHYVAFGSNGKPFFKNPVELNGKNWKTKKVRNVTFHYPPYHSFNQKEADKLIAQIIKLEKEWKLEPINVDYYFANTNDEIARLRGFDFKVGMGNRDKPQGISDDVDNIVYGAGWGENYFHEVVHIYLNRLFTYPRLGEGLTVYYGGSMGHPLDWHAQKVKKYLTQHPELDLQDLANFSYFDNYTNPISTILGVLCKEVYARDGMAGFRRIATYKTEEEFITKEFKSTNINEVVRTVMAKQ